MFIIIIIFNLNINFKGITTYDYANKYNLLNYPHEVLNIYIMDFLY